MEVFGSPMPHGSVIRKMSNATRLKMARGKETPAARSTDGHHAAGIPAYLRDNGCSVVHVVPEIPAAFAADVPKNEKRE
ncbi:MAG: hypothetical protein U1E61_03975 [Bradyrhizobium sp.]